ncbi:MAG: hypothetical protein RSC31_00605 [Anaerovoracaceae bacterium]
MKNRRINRILAILLSLAMVFSLSVTVYAASGKVPAETVYVLLDTAGATREIIVKNDGNETKGVKGELPFDIRISYSLDGDTVDPAEVVGESGDVKITVKITPNKDAKAYYRENLALQMQFPIDFGITGKATDIVANGLTGVTVGTVKTLSSIVMPGKSAKYQITYNTKYFELQSINFVCMPFDMAEMADINISDIGSQITKLQKGIGQYVDGVSQVSSGLSQFNKGVKDISGAGKGLVDGYTQLSGGETALINGLVSMLPADQQQALAPQLKALQDGQKQFADGLAAYTGGVTQATAAVDKLSSGAAELARNGVTLKKGVNSASAPLSEIQGPTNSKAKSFISNDKVSEIQFVMKTDSATVDKTKDDVAPATKEKGTFWSRLLALFGF